MRLTRLAGKGVFTLLVGALAVGSSAALAQRPIQRPGQVLLVPDSPPIGSGLKDSSPQAEALRAQGAEVDLERAVPTVIWTDERLTDEQLPLLKDIAQLEKLVIRDRPITDDGLLAIKDLQHLWVLNLSNTKVTDGVLKTIQSLIRLKRLYLGGTAVTDALLKPLSEMPELSYLELPPQISDGAIAQFRDALPQTKVVRETKLKPGSPEAAEARAKALRDQGLFGPAIALYRPIAETAFKKSPQKPHTLELVRGMIDMYRAAGKYKKALPLCRVALKQSEGKLRPPDQEFSDDLFNLVEVLQLQGELGDARAEAKKALAARKKRFGADHLATAHAWFVLGEAAMYEIDVDAAAEAFGKSLEIREKKLDAKHPALAQSRLRVGQVARYRQEYHHSLAEIRKALAAAEAGHLNDAPAVAEIVSELARSLISVGIFNPFFERGWLITDGDFDNRHSLPVMVGYCGAIGRAGQFDAAAPLLREALEACERLLGPNHPESIKIWNCMADNYQTTRRFADAAACADRALAIARLRYGEEHVIYASALFKAAVQYRFLEQFDKAESLFQQVLQLIEKSPVKPLDRDTRYLVHVFLGQIYAEQKRWPECLEQFDQAVREIRQFVLGQMPVLEDETKPYYLQMYRTELVWPLGMAWFRRSDQAFVDRAAEWVLNIQGLNVELTADPALSLRDGKDPSARQLSEKLTALLERMNIESDKIVGERFSPESAELWTEEVNLHSQLGAWMRKHERPHDWIKLDDVRAALPENSVLVVTRRETYLAYDIKQMAGLRYYAFIIPPRGHGKVEIKIIGPSEQYEQEIGAINGQFERIAKTPASGDWKTIEKEDQQSPLRPIMQELEPSIGAFERWLIVPDALLWRMPWAGLRLADHSWAIEKHEICLLHGARSLLAPASSVKPGPPLVISSPNLDYGAGANDAQQPRYAPLPSAGRELAAFMPTLAKLGGKPVNVTGDKASENALKDVRSPRIMVLSAQTYFDQTSLRQNWLGKVGLVLAGANAGSKPYDSSLNDGILRGLDVLNFDLRGTQLVVLSAGQSGETVDSRSEVVPGLQTAFELAGARSVLSAIRQPTDEESVDLLPPFFEALAAGESKAAALRKAQLKLIETYRLRQGGTHPGQWANFVLLGDPN